MRVLTPVAILIAVSALGGWLYYPTWRFTRDLQVAEAAFQDYDFQTARERLAQCAERRPKDAAVQLLACRAARRDGDLIAAEEHYSRYRLLVPDPPLDGALERTLMDAQSGKVADVIDVLMYQVDARNPRAEEILESLAIGCVHLYQLDRAIFWVNQLLTRHSRNPIGRLLKAQTMSTLGRTTEAIDVLRELVREFPRNVPALLSLGEMLMIKNQREEAADAFARARTLSPGESKALHGLARAQLRLERKDELRFLIPELERQDDNSEALLLCGRFATLEARWADAERYLNRAVQLAPNDHEIHRELAACLYQLGKVDAARQHENKVREIETDLVNLAKHVEAMLKAPNDPAPRLEAGRLCFRNGQTSEGLRWLLGILEMDPGHKPTHQALADYYATQGDAGRAAYHRGLSK